MVWPEVATTLLRELLRALLTPLRVLLYLPYRHRWRRLGRETLAAAAGHGTDPTDALAPFFAKGHTPRGPRPHVFVSAGEASGEAHAVRVMQALRDDGIRWSCFGGQAMAAQGGTVLYPLGEHAVMGLLGVLRQLPMLVRAFSRYLRLLRDDPPDLVLLVDYPGLHLVMAKAARRHRIPVLHYVAPQYWAWGPWRMRRYRRSVDATLTILPFETEFFSRCAVPARYVGHPLLDELDRQPPDPTHAAEVRARPTLCLLPGSRRQEIRANLPGMLEVARSLKAGEPALRVVLPHRDEARTPLIRELLARHGGDFVEHRPGALADWIAGARLCLVKSGTGSLEACLHGTPSVVVYRLRGPLATLGYHNLLGVPWIAAANLIAGREVVPEFCFHRNARWQAVAAAASRLWHDEAAREQCRRDLGEVRARLGAPGAAGRAAAVVRTFLDGGGRK